MANPVANSAATSVAMALPRALFLACVSLLGGANAFADEEPQAPPRLSVPDSSIYTTQERPFQKKGHVEITPIFAVTLNNRYSSALAGVLSLTYHLRENVAIEGIGGYAASRYSDATNELLQKEQRLPHSAELKWMEWFAGGDLRWAPLYGKMRIVPGFLGVYDLYIAAGFAAVGTRSPCKPGEQYRGNGLASNGSDVQGISGLCAARPNNTLPASVRVAGNFGLGMSVLFNSYFGLRLELRDLVYSDSVTSLSADRLSEDVSTTIRHQVFFFLGASLLL